MLLENGSQGKQAKKYIENIKEDFELRNIQFKDRTAWRQLISSTSSSSWWRTRKEEEDVNLTLRRWCNALQAWLLRSRPRAEAFLFELTLLWRYMVYKTENRDNGQPRQPDIHLLRWWFPYTFKYSYAHTHRAHLQHNPAKVGSVMETRPKC